MSLLESLRRATGVPFRRPGVWWAIAFSGVALLVVLSLMPDPPSLDTDRFGWGGHGLSYAVLMGWFSRLIGERGARLRTAFALVALGVVLECLQGLTGYRTFDVGDMGANTLGVLAGWVLSPPRVPNGLPALDHLLFGARG